MGGREEGREGKASKSNRLLALSFCKEQNMTKHQTGRSQNSWKYKQNHSFPSKKRKSPRPLHGLQKGGGGGGKFTRNSVPINGRAGSLCTQHLVEVHLCDTQFPVGSGNATTWAHKDLKACGAGFFKLSGQEPHHALGPCQRQSRGSLSLFLEVRTSHQHPQRPQREKTEDLEHTGRGQAGQS